MKRREDESREVKCEAERREDESREVKCESKSEAESACCPTNKEVSNCFVLCAPLLHFAPLQIGK